LSGASVAPVGANWTSQHESAGGAAPESRGDNRNQKRVQMMSTVHLNMKSFADTVKNGIVVLDWWASWCGPCRAFAPIFEKAAEDHPDIVFGKINTEEELELSSAFGIRSIPTLMIFRDGILLFNQPGMLATEEIKELLAQARALDIQQIRGQIAEEKQANESSGPEGAEGPRKAD
jgi:thioredoxin 1